jgi:hypothetical protein
MKRIVQYLLLTLLLTLSLYAQPSQEQIAIVIDLAGKQRMLTQKMSKEALLIAKGIDVKKNQEELKQTIALFDTTLKGLLQGDEKLQLPKTTDKDIIQQLNSISSLWSKFKPFIDRVAEGNYDRTSLKAIEMGNTPLLQSMNRIVEMYEKRHTSELSPQIANTINLAGRERMLIQKMTKELLLIAHNLESHLYMKSLQQGGNFFKKTLFDLINSKESHKDTQIKEEINQIKALWEEYQYAIANTELSKEGLAKFTKKEQKVMKELTQKLIHVATKIDKKRYQNALKKSAIEFETILDGLIHGSKELGIPKTKNSAIQKELNNVQKLWNSYKKVIKNTDTSEEGLKKAMEINMPLLESMDRVVTLYKKE